MLLELLYFLREGYFLRKNSGRTIDLDEDREPHDNIEPELEHEQNVTENVEDNNAQETQVVRRSSSSLL